MPELSELLPALNCSLTYHEHFLILNWTSFLKSEIEYVPYEQILRALNTMVSGIRNLGIRNSGIRTSEIWNSGIRNSGIRNLGIRNSEIRNSGIQTSKIWNSGIRNSDIENSKIRNSGIQNSGIRNFLFSQDIDMLDDIYHGTKNRRMRNRWEHLERKRKVELGKGREKGWRSINNDMSFFYYFLSVLFL